ncbi:helix-turn-helix domain-containing protein [Pseudomonas allokribbensis]|uniref:helix-turn-helix domain-containing protein n=1 Tax=Pseudomonas allokribbensis TaxID=2774460 RepID=UPI001787E469|nr:helix-turn-helix transcriptional regulator [Pseudomonas allokribbensis]
MELNQAFGVALQRLRKSKALTQEDFSTKSSRTYLSTLERGLKSPTLEKLQALASVMGVQPLTLLAYAQLLCDEGLSLDELLSRVRDELALLHVEG